MCIKCLALCLTCSSHSVMVAIDIRYVSMDSLFLTYSVLAQVNCGSGLVTSHV